MLYKEMRTRTELPDHVENYDDWASTVVTWSLSVAIAGLLFVGLIINFLLV